MEKIIELKPIPTPQNYFEQMEERLKKHFKETIYFPLLRELNYPKQTITNANESDPLIDALFKGRVTYHEGTFSGRFSAAISKRLKEIGAIFDKKESTFKLPFDQIPMEIKNLILSTESRFEQKLAELDRVIQKIVPEEIAGSFQSQDLFDKTLWKADQEFHKNVKNIAAVPQLSDEQREKIASEWQNNMKLWIKGWVEDQIKDLRKKIQTSTFEGNRYGSLIETIQKSYGVSANKAKFLARQETHLLMSKFKEVRYTESGIHEYIWRCVHRPKDTDPKKHTPGNVRYSHGILDGKVFRFDSPPVTSNPGEAMRRNNPGEDYNCRCYARGIIRKK